MYLVTCGYSTGWKRDTHTQGQVMSVGLPSLGLGLTPLLLPRLCRSLKHSIMGKRSATSHGAEPAHSVEKRARTTKVQRCQLGCLRKAWHQCFCSLCMNTIPCQPYMQLRYNSSAEIQTNHAHPRSSDVNRVAFARNGTNACAPSMPMAFSAIRMLCHCIAPCAHCPSQLKLLSNAPAKLSDTIRVSFSKSAPKACKDSRLTCCLGTAHLVMLTTSSVSGLHSTSNKIVPTTSTIWSSAAPNGASCSLRSLRQDAGVRPH